MKYDDAHARTLHAEWAASNSERTLTRLIRYLLAHTEYRFRQQAKRLEIEDSITTALTKGIWEAVKTFDPGRGMCLRNWALNYCRVEVQYEAGLAHMPANSSIHPRAWWAYRCRGAEGRGDLEPTVDSGVLRSDRSADELLAAYSVCEAFARLLGQYQSSRSMDALHRHWFDGLTIEQAAAEQQISRSAVNQLARHVEERFRRRIA